MLAPYRGACELALARYRKFSGKLGLVEGAESEAAERDPAVGPYRLEPNGDLRPIKVQQTAYDEALVDRYPWLRASREALQESACGVDSAHRERGLIQLRRPKGPSYVARYEDGTKDDTLKRH